MQHPSSALGSFHLAWCPSPLPMPEHGMVEWDFPSLQLNRIYNVLYPLSGHLCCFRILAVADSAAMKIVQIGLRDPDFASFG